MHHRYTIRITMKGVQVLKTQSKTFHIIIFKLHTGGGSNPPLPIYVYLKEKRPWTQYRNSFSDIYLQKKKENYNISFWVISPQFGIKVLFLFFLIW